MKTQNLRSNTSNKKRVVILAVVILAGLILAGAYAMSKKNDNKEALPGQSGYKGPVQTSPAAETEPTVDNNPSGTPTPSSGPTNSASVTISNFSEDEAAVHVRAIVEGASEGTCELELSKNGATSLNKTTGIVPNTSYYSCGFDIPKSEIEQSGIWTAIVKIKGSSATTASATLNISK